MDNLGNNVGFFFTLTSDITFTIKVGAMIVEVAKTGSETINKMHIALSLSKKYWLKSIFNYPTPLTEYL